MKQQILERDLDRSAAAAAIRGALAINGIRQCDLARKLQIHNPYLNAFLRRKLDLLPQDIARIMKHLDIYDSVIDLTVKGTEKKNAIKKVVHKENEI